MVKKRQRIAEYLIEHASSLPYDCATELDVQVIPSDVLHQDSGESISSPELHFVQATWDPSEHAFTLEELQVGRSPLYMRDPLASDCFPCVRPCLVFFTAAQGIFGAFGVVVNLGVNEANDR